MAEAIPDGGNRWYVVVVYLLSCVQLFATPWTSACRAFLSFIVSWSLLKFMSIDSVMTSNHLILCCPLLLLPLVFPSIRVFSSEFALRIRWPKYWSFCISPSLHPIYQQILLALPSIYISSWPLSSTSASLTPSPFFWISLITSKLVFLLPFLLPYNPFTAQKQNGFF